MSVSIDLLLKAHSHRLRKDSRAAILASKRAIDTQSRSRREELLRSPSVPDQVTPSNEKVTFVSPSLIAVTVSELTWPLFYSPEKMRS